MALQAFSRTFPGELECDILERLGQRDLLSTFLVCRRFRAISGPLLLRHIARYRVLVDEQGNRTHPLLPKAYKVFARLIQDSEICRHVRYFEVPTDFRPYAVPPDAFRTMWLSMTNLVALSLCAKFIIGFDWGLEDIYFPMLRRLRVDSHSLCPSLITLHIHSLTHLRLDDNVDVPPDDTQPASLTHYHGPLDTVLRFSLHARTLQVCAIYERDVNGRAEWPSLSPLAACHSLRTLMVDLEASEADLLHMLKDCPPFPSMDILFLAYNSVWSNHYPTQPHLQKRREPCFHRLLAPFPTTTRIAVLASMTAGTRSKTAIG
ncbi:hypothetical protein EXIGLDRAFT_841819 [Exidia glandulosa HHB12029]|uniref:F-box domain-containing protein n=1 Tax=Exidia glandulosa HHB12029 TaxID=1314781 RepID=A0A165DN07_EXIGL|nr:hypothetical protein EXIGLDRAFT_841819 [Exidia glandulosa HHB12029]